MSTYQTINCGGELDYLKVLPTLDLNFTTTKTLDPRIGFSRSSGATYVDKDGLIKIAGVNQPRFDHDPLTGECKGLLIEETKTNQITYSNAQGNSLGWYFDGNKGGLNGSSGKNYFVVSPNTTETLAPDGTFTATKLTAPSTILNPTSTPGISEFDYALHLVSTISTTGNPLTCSFYVKDPSNFANGLNKIGIMSGGLFNPAKQYATFNLVNKQTSSANATITACPNGWYRLTFVVSEGGVFGFNAWNGLTSSLYIWGAQLEATSFPTSYIPTNASTITRAEDNTSITGTNFSRWYNINEGSFKINMQFITTPTTEVAFGYGFFDLSPDGFIIQNRVGSNYSVRTNYFGFNAVSLGTNKNLNISVGYSDQVATIISNQSVIGSLSINSLTANSLIIGKANRPGTWGTGSSLAASAIVSRILYYPKKLSTNELKNLTN